MPHCRLHNPAACRLLSDDSPHSRELLRQMLYGKRNRLDVDRLLRIVDGFSSFTTDGLVEGDAAGAGAGAAAAQAAGAGRTGAQGSRALVLASTSAAQQVSRQALGGVGVANERTVACACHGSSGAADCAAGLHSSCTSASSAGLRGPDAGGRDGRRRRLGHAWPLKPADDADMHDDCRSTACGIKPVMPLRHLHPFGKGPRRRPSAPHLPGATP